MDQTTMTPNPANPNLTTREAETSLKKIAPQYRSITLDRADIDEDKRTLEISFSSETPVERYFGSEILDHKPASIRLDRLRTGGPLLMDHFNRDQVGVIEKVTISARKGRAVVRFGRSGRAEEIFQDVLDGIRTNVSVGYRIHKMVLEESGDDGDKFRIVDWEPFEISMVAVPADTAVGVGRGVEALVTDHEEPSTTPEIIISTDEEDDVNRNRNSGGGDDAETLRLADEARLEQERQSQQQTQQSRSQDPEPVNVQVIEGEAVKAERLRISTITELCARHKTPDLVADAVSKGTTIDELRGLILDARHGDPNNGDGIPTDTGEIGMTEREVGNFSFCRLIDAIAMPSDRKASEVAAFELEVVRTTSDELQKREIRSPRSEFVVPYDVLRSPIGGNDPKVAERVMQLLVQRGMIQQRDLVVGTAAAGGDLVATDLLSGSFIDILRDSSFVMQMATVLNDLQGDVAIPRQTAATTGVWIATEQGGATEDDAAFDQVTLTPKEIGSFSEYSRKLIVQSSIDIEAFVRADLAMGLGLAVSSAAINADGTGGAPTGIRATSGIGSVAGGANGAAPDWDDVVTLETEISQDNALLGRLAYAVNAVTRGKFKRTFIDSGSGERIWDSRAGATPVNGYPAMLSNQMPSNLTKGLGTNLSSIVFGDWAALLVALWSGVDLLVNPYTGDTTRTTRVTAFQDADVAVRHPESFASMEDAITT